MIENMHLKIAAEPRVCSDLRFRHQEPTKRKKGIERCTRIRSPGTNRGREREREREEVRA